MCVLFGVKAELRGSTDFLNCSSICLRLWTHFILYINMFYMHSLLSLPKAFDINETRRVSTHNILTETCLF